MAGMCFRPKAVNASVGLSAFWRRGGCKSAWNTSQSKYSTFWDAQGVLKKFVKETLNWNYIPQVRDRLIIACRLLNLSRSIDLTRTWRCQSQVGNILYILAQRKNQKRPQWEAIVRLDNSPSVFPYHLPKRYFSLTALLVPAGSLLLRQLKPPFSLLSSNTVGSITKNIFTTLWCGH